MGRRVAGVKKRVAAFGTRMRNLSRRKVERAKSSRVAKAATSAYNKRPLRRKILRGLGYGAAVGLGSVTLNPLVGYGAYRLAKRRLSTKGERAQWKAEKQARKAKAKAGRRKLVRGVIKAVRLPGKAKRAVRSGVKKVVKGMVRTQFRAATGYYGRRGAKRLRKWGGLD